MNNLFYQFAKPVYLYHAWWCNLEYIYVGVGLKALSQAAFLKALYFSTVILF